MASFFETVEIVVGVVVVCRVVGVLRYVRCLDHGLSVFPGVAVVGLRGDDHAAVGRFQIRAVRPPVDVGIFAGEVFDDDADEQVVLRQRCQHGVDDAALAFVFVHFEGFAARRVFVACDEQRGAGEGMVADDADVPFDAAGEPRVAEREVGGLEDVVAEQKLTVFGLGVEGPETAAEFGGEFRAEVFVFENGGFQSAFGQGAVVAVLHGIRKHAVDAALVNPRGFVRTEVGGGIRDSGRGRAGRVGRLDIGEDVRGAEIGCGDPHFGEFQHDG